MIFKKIVKLSMITVISSLIISCASKNISVSENISKVKNNDVYFTDMIVSKSDLKVDKVTNEKVVNHLLTNIKWTERKSDDGTTEVYATGKYKDIELAKKYASITPLFFIAVFTDKYVEWDKLGDQERTEAITSLKETADNVFKLSNSSEVIFRFNDNGDLQEDKDDKLIFHTLVFFGCTIYLSGIDTVIKLPPLNVF